VPLTQWSTSYSPLFVGNTHRVTSRLWFVWRRTWQRCVSWRTHTTQRLDSGLPSHAPGTGHSIKEARQALTSPWSPHRARCQRKEERPHVYARSCQDGCKLGYSSSQRGDSHPKCIRTISGLGASGSTDAQADAAIRRQFQEAHGPSPKLPSTYGRRIVQCVDRFLYHGINARRNPTDYFGLGKPAVAGE